MGNSFSCTNSLSGFLAEDPLGCFPDEFDPSDPQTDLCDVCNEASYRSLFEQEPVPAFDSSQLVYVFPKRTLEHVKKSGFCTFCKLTLTALGIESEPVSDPERDVYVVCGPVRMTGHSCVVKGTDFRLPYLGEPKCTVEHHDHETNRPRPMRKTCFHLVPKEIAGDTQAMQDSKYHENTTHNFQMSHLDSPARQRMSSLERANHDLFSGREMGPTVDVDLIKAWLSNSENEMNVEVKVPVEAKADTKSEIAAEIETAVESELTTDSKVNTQMDTTVWVPTTFIGIAAKKLVQGTTDRRYAILSYVWGEGQEVVLDKTTSQFLFAEGGFTRIESKLAHTIADAIALCAKIDIPYLWVDSLCIRQDDQVDKERQIPNMGHIYGSAAVTIVNASTDPNTNAYTPLPGFSIGTRNVLQKKASIRGHSILLTKRPVFRKAVSTSKWFTRAWTLQELYLSRRLLFFTDQQVFLSTRSGRLFCEDTVFEHEHPDVRAWCMCEVQGAGNATFDWDYTFSFTALPTPEEKFMSLVSSFTRRHLTHQEDALAAITAVIEAFTPSIGKIIFGTPWAIFDFVVRWDPGSGSLTRRPMFPSWSWVGWNGPLQWKMNLNPEENPEIHYYFGTANDPVPLGSALVDNESDYYEHLWADYGFHVGPKAASPAQIDRYYQSLLGHSRQSPAGTPEDFFLHFTTSIHRLNVSPTGEVGKQYPQPGDVEGAPPSSRQPEGIDIYYILVGFQQRSRPDPIDETLPWSASLKWSDSAWFMPIEMETVRACDDCQTTHLVARRIGHRGLLLMSMVEWLALEPKPQETFVVLG